MRTDHPLRRFLPVAVLAAAICFTSGVVYEVTAAQPPTVAQVSEGLTCQCGCGLTVANCNHPSCGFSVPVRAEIEQMIKRGMTQAQIIAFYRHKYGEKVLSAPTTEGFNLLAWVMPFAAIGVGGGGILLVLGRWRRAPRSAQKDAPLTEDALGAERAADSELRRRLENEIKESI
jgi:cytochrome c-type biogenesis protein CcmH